MSRRREYLDLLAQVPLFAACERAELKALDANAGFRSVGVGRELVREGEPGEELFILIDGTARVNRGGRIVDHLGPGDFFGELALLDPAPRNATVTATSELDLLVISRAQFDAVLGKAPGMARSLLAGMARRIRDYDGTPNT
ncbi:MAG TPA: cyclic nucleotide-binding domain-containing protein [Sporichthya sp.]|nr:cyclic nucleotide-binding domain-containing protein [Sporichthya sp.]